MVERNNPARAPCALSPLAELAPPEGDPSLVERAGLGAIGLRGAGPRFFATAARIFGVALPARANATARVGDSVALWLGPDEWLVRLPYAEAAAAAAAMRGGLANEHAAAVDVSDRACVLRLAGPRSREVLAQGCPLDLHPRAFGPGACARSRYFEAAILIDQVDEHPTYDLQTPRSFAPYLWALLVEARREFAGGD